MWLRQKKVGRDEGRQNGGYEQVASVIRSFFHWLQPKTAFIHHWRGVSFSRLKVFRSMSTVMQLLTGPHFSVGAALRHLT